MGRRIPEKDVITKLAQERTGDYGGRKLQECLQRVSGPHPRPLRGTRSRPRSGGREQEETFCGGVPHNPQIGKFEGAALCGCPVFGPTRWATASDPDDGTNPWTKITSNRYNHPHQVSREARSAILLIAISLIDAHRFLCYIPLKS